MDRFRFAFGFLMFHRRFIMGILILIGLYFFLTVLLPKFSRDTRLPDPPVRKNEQLEAVLTAEPPAEMPAVEKPQRTSDQLIELTDVDELFRELTRMKAIAATAKSDGAALLYAKDSIKIAKRMLELPTSSEQRRFALASIVESLLLMRLISVQSNLSDLMIDEEFISQTKDLINDPDPLVSLHATVAVVASAIFEFHSEPSEEHLRILQSEVENNFDNLAKFPSEIERIWQLVVGSNLYEQDRVSVDPFVERFTSLMLNHDDQKVRDTGKAFTITSAFRKLNSSHLVFNLGDKSEASDRNAEQFFRTLEQYPDAAISIYQISLDVIKEYILQQRNDRAVELLEILENRILPNRTDESTRQNILDALQELKRVIR